MKAFLAKFRDITISGILAILPLYVFLLVIAKAWKSLNSIGAGIAQMLGMKSILCVGGATVVSGLLTVAIWLLTGVLVRYSFLGAVSKAAERQLSKYVPDYDRYKAKAEEKLQHKVRVLPYKSALIRWEEYWQPGYIVEQEPLGWRGASRVTVKTHPLPLATESESVHWMGQHWINSLRLPTELSTQ